MKLSKEMLRSLVLEEVENVIQEATTEEIGHLDDVLEIPKSDLPFQNIFGDRYRILGSFRSDSPSSPFSQLETFLNRTGWEFNKDDISQVVKNFKSLYIGNPDDGIQSRTKEMTFSVVKFFLELEKYLNGLPGVMKEYVALSKEIEAYGRETLGHKGRGFKREFFKDKKFLSMSRKKLSLSAAIGKFIPGDNAVMRVFSDMGRIDWSSDEAMMKGVEDFFKLSSLKRQSKVQQKWLVGEKGTGKKNYEIFAGMGYDEYKELGKETEYVVFSRHPIDVFRMSDHEGLQSCHTIPSSRDKLGASPSEEKWDQYNICALAEAHANGMIAYALNPDLPELEGEALTQDYIDQYEDGELFTDDERDVGIFTPLARLRIKNVAFLADKGDYSEVLSRVAVPEKRSYGDNIPGFVEYVNKTITTSQEDKIADILEKTGDVIDFRNFLRVGGSYQDNNVENSLFDMLKRSSGRELEYENSTQYSAALEQSLKDMHQGTNEEDAIEVLEDLKNEYNRGFINFDNLSVEEDWNGGDSFYITGDVAIIWRYEDEIFSFSNVNDVRDAMEEAMDEASDIYFYDDGWMNGYSVMFDSFLGGSKNTMIIRFPFSGNDSAFSDEYHPYSPDTWLYAFEEIQDKINHVMDPHADDSLNNFIKHFISYTYPGNVKTDVSGEYLVGGLKTLLEEDGNWVIEDEQEDYESSLPFGITTFFTVKNEEGASLGSAFANLSGGDYDEDEPDQVERAKKMSGALATIISVLQSEGMSALKASLLDDAFIANPDKYDSLSAVTSFENLDMKVVASIGWGTGSDEISPERIYKGIAEDDDLNLEIHISISQSDWTHVDSEVIGKMMAGDFNDNNGWHIDADEVLEAMIGSDLARLSQPKGKEDVKEFIEKEIRLLLRSR